MSPVGVGMALARMRLPDATLPALVAYSSGSSTRGTITRHQLEDGTQMIITADPLEAGCLVRVFLDLDKMSVPLRAVGRQVVATDEAAVFSLELDHAPRLVVVHPVFTAGGPELMSDTVPELHEAFAQAVNRYPTRGSLVLKPGVASDLRVDRFAFFVQSMDDNLLSAAGLGVYR
jgi:hypothetical protein